MYLPYLTVCAITMYSMNSSSSDQDGANGRTYMHIYPQARLLERSGD